jgi:uroporphyrinogen decarboxylase
MTKKLLNVLAGEAVWPPPLWLMRQAGRYLPEYRQFRAQAGDFLSLCFNPKLAAEVTLQPVRRYGMDAAILFSDILVVPWGLGQGLSFNAGEGPVLPPIRDEMALAALDEAGFMARVAPVMETVANVKAALDPAAALIGFAGSPWTVACYMVEGSGSRDWAGVREVAYRQPALFNRLIEMVTKATIAYLSAQITAGAETVMLFDSWVGVLPPSLFRQYGIAPVVKIVERINQLHPNTPIIGFPRGAGASVEEYADATGVNAVGLDTAVDVKLARDWLPHNVAIQGNMDPVLLLAGGTMMEREVRNICDQMRGHPHIFNLGHGILPQTDPAVVADLVRIVRNG